MNEPLTSRLRRWLTHPTFLALVALSLLWMLFFWRLLTPNLADRMIFDQRGDFMRPTLTPNPPWSMTTW